MFIFEILFLTLAHLVNAICTIFFWLIVARIVVSWVGDPYNPIVQFLIQATDPILLPFQRLPLRVGMLDLSPVLAVFAIQLVNALLSGILFQWASQMK